MSILLNATPFPIATSFCLRIPIKPITRLPAFSMLAVIADFGYFLHRRVPLPLEPVVLGLVLFQGRGGILCHARNALPHVPTIPIRSLFALVSPWGAAAQLYGSNQLFNFHQVSSSPSGNLQWVGV